MSQVSDSLIHCKKSYARHLKTNENNHFVDFDLPVM